MRLIKSVTNMYAKCSACLLTKNTSIDRKQCKKLKLSGLAGKSLKWATKQNLFIYFYFYNLMASKVTHANKNNINSHMDNP